MKKKIWILNHHANDMYFDEGGRHYSFAKYLKRAGYEPTIFCSNAEHGSGKKYFDGVKIAQEHMAEKIGVPFVFVKGRGYADNGINRILCMLDYYINVRRYAKIYVKNNGKPDIIIGSSVHPLACVAGIKLARKLKVPCIAEIRDLWPETLVAYNIASPKNIAVKMLYRLERWIYVKADAIIFTMEGAYDYIAKQGWEKEIPKEKVHYINNGVDLEEFDRNEEQFCVEDIDLQDKNIFKVIYVGSIRKVNNLGLLLDAAKLVKNENVVFLIWGSGDELGRLKERVETEHIGNVRFKGRVDKKYIPYITSHTDVNFCHGENSPIAKYGLSMNKMFDYLAAGRPILTDYSSPYSPIVQCGAAVWIKSPDAVNIAGTIDEMSGMEKEDLKELGRNAREGAKQYDFKNLTERLETVIIDI